MFSVGSKYSSDAHACNCVGPQNGQPLCPCMMRGVEIKDGRYVKTIDYGPVTQYIDYSNFMTRK